MAGTFGNRDTESHAQILSVTTPTSLIRNLKKNLLLLSTIPHLPAQTEQEINALLAVHISERLMKGHVTHSF